MYYNNSVMKQWSFPALICSMSGESIQAEKKEKVILDKLWSQMHDLKYVLQFITIQQLITDTLLMGITVLMNYYEIHLTLQFFNNPNSLYWSAK